MCFYFQVGWIRPHPHLTCASLYRSVLSQLVTCRVTPFILYLNNLLFPEPWIPIPNTKYLFQSLKGNVYPYSIFEVCFCTSWENEQHMGNKEAAGEILLATSVLDSVSVSGSCASTTLASTKYQPQPAPTPSPISPGQYKVSGGSRARRRRRHHKQPLLNYGQCDLQPAAAAATGVATAATGVASGKGGGTRGPLAEVASFFRRRRPRNRKQRLLESYESYVLPPPPHCFAICTF